MSAADMKDRGFEDRVAGVFLINCAGGMNQKGLYGDDLLLRLLSPVFGAPPAATALRIAAPFSSWLPMPQSALRAAFACRAAGAHPAVAARPSLL